MVAHFHMLTRSFCRFLFQVSIVSNSGLNMITSGCYVNKPELGADCTPRLLMEGGNQSSFTCCNSDRCNDDTLVQGKNSHHLFSMIPIAVY